MRRFTICSLALLLGCRPGPAASTSTPPAGRAQATLTTPDEDSAPKREGAGATVVRWSEGEPLAEGTATPSRKLVQGGVLALDDHAGVGSTLLVARLKQRHGAGMGWWLVDVAKGKTLAEFPGLWGESHESKVALITVDKKLDALLHLEDGAIVRVQPKLAPGRKAAQTSVFLFPTNGAAWVFVKTKDGKVYGERWRDLRKPQLAMTREFPFFPTYRSWDAGPVVGTNSEFEAPGEGPCPFALLRDDGSHECRTEAKREGDWLDASHEWDSETSSIVKGNESVRLLPECTPSIFSIRGPRPRVWGMCDRDGGQDIAVWTPQRRVAFRMDRAGAVDQVEMGRNGIDALGDCKREGEACTFSRWVDTKNGRMFDTPALELVGATSDVVIVRAKTEPRHVAVLDFERAELRKIGISQPCPEPLMAQIGGKLAAITCPRPDPKSGAVFVGWRKVVDLASGRAWNADDLGEIWFTENGEIVEHRTAAQGDELWVVELR